MNILKKYSMAIVAVMIVIGFSAFRIMESPKPDTDYFFEVNTNGSIGDFLTTSVTELSIECRTGTVTECAVRLDSEHVDNSGHAPQSMIADLIDLSNEAPNTYDIYKKN